MRPTPFVIWVILATTLFAALAAANQNKGAADMMLEGGTKGKVSFPHRKHQDNLKDCAVCHDLFPQAAGAIEEYKAGGKLEKKQVMNKLCTKCHKAEKEAGKKSGPVTCASCHVK